MFTKDLLRMMYGDNCYIQRTAVWIPVFFLFCYVVGGDPVGGPVVVLTLKIGAD